MASKKKFMMDLVVALMNDGSYGNIDDSDHPTCPSCGATMDFQGDLFGYTKIGDGRWVCPSCSYTVTEDELSPYYKKYDDNPWKYE